MANLRVLPAKKTYRTICSFDPPVFAFGDTQILRERNRAFSRLVLRLNINRPGPETLNQLRPNVDICLAQTLWTQLLPGGCSTVGWTVLKGFFALEMAEPVM